MWTEKDIEQMAQFYNAVSKPHMFYEPAMDGDHSIEDIMQLKQYGEGYIIKKPQPIPFAYPFGPKE